MLAREHPRRMKWQGLRSPWAGWHFTERAGFRAGLVSCRQFFHFEACAARHFSSVSREHAATRERHDPDEHPRHLQLLVGAELGHTADVGHDPRAKAMPPAARTHHDCPGLGYLLAEGGEPRLMRCYYLDDERIRRHVAAARVARAGAKASCSTR